MFILKSCMYLPILKNPESPAGTFPALIIPIQLKNEIFKPEAFARYSYITDRSFDARSLISYILCNLHLFNMNNINNNNKKNVNTFDINRKVTYILMFQVHKRLHSGVKPYKCEDCGRHFRQWGDLKYHSMSIHSEQRQFQCEYCGKDFARKYSLIVHRRIHTGEKNYRCEYCNKTFRASSYLQNHRRIHTGEKPHPCTVCGKPFRVRSDMKRHMHTHTRGKPDRPAANKIAVGKNLNDDSDDKGCHARTIQDLVQELKLEVEPNGVVEIVPPEDNPESILPHGGQNLEYTVTTNNDVSNDRDPLEAGDRTSDTLYVFF